MVADTVVARSYQGGNECQRLDGVKLQAQAHDQPSQIVMHVRMLDVEAWLQQEALGIVGVNLLYGAFFHHHEPEKLIESLLDELTIGRIEIDESSRRWTTSRSSPSCSRCTTTWRAGAASSTWTTTGPSTCTSSAATCCAGSAANDDSWEEMVPEQCAELIKRRGFFGYVKPGARD